MSDRVALGSECTLCGGPQDGKEIDVGGGKPDETGVVHWAHTECVDYMDRVFVEAHRESDGFADFFENGGGL